MPVRTAKITGNAKIVIRAKPSIYIDTNICRDFIRGERGIEAIQALGIIRDRGYSCFTSIFTVMELIDTEKDSVFFIKKLRRGWDFNKMTRARYQKDLTETDLEEAGDAAVRFFNQNSFIKFKNLVADDQWNTALTLGSSSNLFASDIIHLVTAWYCKCSVLLTNDEFFIREGNAILKTSGISDKLRICKPHDLSNTLKDMGFKEEK